MKSMKMINLIPIELLLLTWPSTKKPELLVFEPFRFPKTPQFTYKLAIIWILILCPLLRRNLLRRNCLLLFEDIFLMELMSTGELVNLKLLIDLYKWISLFLFWDFVKNCYVNLNCTRPKYHFMIYGEYH